MVTLHCPHLCFLCCLLFNSAASVPSFVPFVAFCSKSVSVFLTRVLRENRGSLIPCDSNGHGDSFLQPKALDAVIVRVEDEHAAARIAGDAPGLIELPLAAAIFAP